MLTKYKVDLLCFVADVTILVKWLTNLARLQEIPGITMLIIL